MCILIGEATAVFQICALTFLRCSAQGPWEYSCQQNEMPGIGFFLLKVLKKEISASRSRFWGEKGNWEEERVSGIRRERRFGDSCGAGGDACLPGAWW